MVRESPSSIDNAYRRTVDAPLNQVRRLTQKDTNEAIEVRMARWLDDLGLSFHPFACLDAGNDPQLYRYVIGHTSFAATWRDQTSLVFAPAGGGKSTFRVRLARACRMEEDGRRVLPVVYKMPSPYQLGEGKDVLHHHFRFINWALLHELLLALAYRPERYFRLSTSDKHFFWQFLAVTGMTAKVCNLLQQMVAAGKPTPIAEAFDPTATGLLPPPDMAYLQHFCQTLHADLQNCPLMPRIVVANSQHSYLLELVDWVCTVLEYDAVYLLLDGLDGYAETEQQTVAHIKTLIFPLIEQTLVFADHRIYNKYFLPSGAPAQSTITAFLQIPAPVDLGLVNIQWTPTILEELLRSRLHAASNGAFTTMAAISHPTLRNLDQELIRLARKALPRELLTLAGRVFTEHLLRCAEPDLLAQEDVDRAIHWYTKEGLR